MHLVRLHQTLSTVARPESEEVDIPTSTLIKMTPSILLGAASRARSQSTLALACAIMLARLTPIL